MSGAGALRGALPLRAVEVARPRALDPAASRALDAAPPRDDHAKLRSLANQLEGVFLTQLFAAMRASVPHEGIVPRAQGEEMFQSLLDDRVAGVAAERLNRGLGEALYRQLAGRLDAAETAHETGKP